jgi:PPOX class probable FMN-dependent enzyme
MIETPDNLRALYDPPGERALRKQLTALDRHCEHFLSLSPFVVIASVDAQGRLDASPRGGPPGFAHVADAHTLLLPDASGNNRLDTLTNVTTTRRVGLLFLIPGVDESLRINGTALVSSAPALLQPFAATARPPKVVLAVTVEEAYLHCAKALMRARLWDHGSQVERTRLATLGQMLSDQTGCALESQEAMLARYAREL